MARKHAESCSEGERVGDIGNDPFTTSLTLEGDGSLTVIDDASGGPNRFYQIGVRIPP